MPRTVPPNIYRVEGDLAFIEMRNGYTAIIDAEDMGRVMPFHWTAFARERPHKRSSIYVYITGSRGGLHRLIANAPDGKHVDHINCNGLDNRKANLRIVTNSENMQNRSRANRNSKTGVRGVSRMFNGRNEYWCIRVWLGENHFTGKKSITKTFPYTDDGFQEACEQAPILRAQYMTHSEENLASEVLIQTSHVVSYGE